MMNCQELGQFEIKTGKVIVSDPCYDLGTWCQGSLDNIKKGIWNAYVRKSDEGSWGERCVELIVSHESVNPDHLTDWRTCDFEVGVDSGQAGVFDAEVYKNDNSIIQNEKTFMPDDLWYSSCCDLTLSPIGAGVIPGGAVSSSGYGDGGYEASIATNEDGEIVAIKILFIEDEEDEECCDICGNPLDECTCYDDGCDRKCPQECEDNECELHPKMCCLICPNISSCGEPCEDADYDKEICKR